jgi:PiT family inorganic phosphate transporter
MRPRVALYLVAAAELVAPFLVGSAVARAVTTGLVDVSAITLNTLVIAMSAATIWSLLCWWWGIPSSSTHALIGGVVGAAWIINGSQAVIGSGLLRAVLPLLAAPFVGFVVGFILMGLLLLIFSGATPRVNVLFRRLQVVTAVLLAMSNSANDTQKSVGIIALGLVLAGRAASAPAVGAGRVRGGDGARRLARRLASDPQPGGQGVPHQAAERAGLAGRIDGRGLERLSLRNACEHIAHHQYRADGLGCI